MSGELFLTTIPVTAAGVEAIDAVVVRKAERKMDLLDHRAKIVKSYRIALGANPVGPKSQSGDEKTPEGRYTISGRNPGSRYHLSLRVSYPNARNVAQAEKQGVSAGGDIMIHGYENGHGDSPYVEQDWTDGCIGVSNAEIEEIWKMVRDGTRIEILP